MATDAPADAPATSEALAEQLGFYFSDANLRRDRFMKQHVGRDGTGKMSVETLGSFNRVKAITTDRQTLVEALKSVPGLRVTHDGDQVHRTRPVPAKDDSEERTVYIEPLPADATHDALKQLFGIYGKVAYISMPRFPRSDAKGFAFVEFETSGAAARALEASPPPALGGASGEASAEPLRVLSRYIWSEMKQEYKRLLKQGKAEAEAEAAAHAAALNAQSALSAAQAAAEAEEAARRTVLLLSGIGKGAKVKQLRKEMSAVFAADLDYVDYGVSNSGSQDVAYVRFRSAVGAAEAARVAREGGQRFNDRVVSLELLRGEALTAYLEKIAAIQAKKWQKAQSKAAEGKPGWWERKFGKGAVGKRGGADAGAAGGEGGGQVASAAAEVVVDGGEAEAVAEAVAASGAKRPREEDAAVDRDGAEVKAARQDGDEKAA